MPSTIPIVMYTRSTAENGISVHGCNFTDSTVGVTVEGGLDLSLVGGAVGGAIAALLIAVLAITLCMVLLVISRRRKKERHFSGLSTLASPCTV